MGTGDWLDRAVSGIRFGPDRAAVRAELSAHLEDKSADLQRIFPDIPLDEAQDRALSAMGDPEELKAELARVHRPWLGWLWYTCRGMLLAAAAAWLIFAGLPALMGGGEDVRSYYYDSWYRGVQPGEWAPPAPVEAGGFTLEITRASRWEETILDLGVSEEERWGWESASMTLRITARLPWERPPETVHSLEQWMTAADSGGRKFSFRPDPEAEFFSDQPLQGTETGLCWREYELICRDITPGAEWIELRYDFGGNAFTLRADIPERSSYGSSRVWSGTEEGTA